MNVWKPVELALVGAAKVAWPAFQMINRRFEGRPFHPTWAPAPLLKSRERTSLSSAGRARPIRCVRPACVRRAPESSRASSRSSRW